MLKADIGDILNELGGFKPVHDWPLIWRQMLSATEVKELFAYTADGGDVQQNVGQTIKAKFIARERILEIVGKHINVAAFIGLDNRPQIANDPVPLDDKFL